MLQGMTARHLRAAALPAIALGCVLSGVTGCSPPAHSAGPPLGAVDTGSAVVTVGDHDLGQTRTVSCLVTPPLLTITTGDAAVGSTTVISSPSNAEPLRVESVQIRNLDGFTGGYYADLMGRAEVTMTGSTYAISGEAEGVAADSDSFSTDRTFSIRVAC